MRWLPRSLFGRLALLLITLLLACQLFTLALLGYSHQRLEARQLAGQVLDTLAELEPILPGFAPDERAAFLALRNHPYAINLQPADEVIAPGSSEHTSPAARQLLATLSAMGLPTAQARVQWRPKHQVWLPIRLAGEYYWLIIPLGTPEPAMGVTLLWLTGGFSLVALLAAFGFAWLINRPLQQLARAAATIADGRHPAPLPERGMQETRALSSAFNHMSGALQQAEQGRKVMLAGISHDVRTPLTRLRLGVEMMQDDSLRDGMLTDLDDIERIVRQFRDFVAGEPDEPQEPLLLNELILSMAERYRRDGLDIATRLATDLPAVAARPLALQRVLGNLIDNARRYGRPPVELLTRRQNDRVELTVTDHGDGIDESEIDHLQQPFTRGDAARQADGGSGLGLAIVRRICEHDGIGLSFSRPPAGGLAVTLQMKTPR